MAVKLRRDNISLLENGIASGNTLLNDAGVSQVTSARFGSGPVFTVTAAGTTLQGSYGTLVIRSDGTFSYSASTARAESLAAGTVVTETFAYTATGIGGTGSSDIKISITGVNDAPVLAAATATLATITEDNTANGGQTVASFLVLSDVDSGALRGIAVSGFDAGNGFWQYSLNGGVNWITVAPLSNASALLLRSSDLVRFVPDTISGTAATLTYRAWDQTSGTAGALVDTGTGGGQSAFSATVTTATIAVTSINDAPVAVAASASGIQNGPPVTGTLQASDVDSPVLTFALEADSVVGGTVTIDSITGDYSFAPATDFSGTGSFLYRASDGSLLSAPTKVTVTIAGVNTAPVAAPDSATTVAQTPVLIDVLANDSDANHDVLTITEIGTAGHGSITLQGGKLLYAAEAGFIGVDNFTYTITDGNGGSALGNVAVTVVAPAPVPDLVTLTFRQGTDGYAGTIDTALRQSRAGTAYGEAIKLHGVIESGKEFQPLLRFDALFGATGGQIPIGATIVSATLRLEVTEGSSDGGTINRMLTGWSGASTWNSTGNGIQIDGIEATAEGAIAVGAVGVGSRAFDVTSSLSAWNGAATTAAGQNAANFGWLFKAAALDGWDFTSAQGAIRPVLTVTYTMQGAAPAASPAVSIEAAAARENDGSIAFTVSLSEASSRAVEVVVTTADHTALAGADYAATRQTLTFAPGETSKAFSVALIDDQSAERPEQLVAQIVSATNATVAAPMAFGRITDDDIAVAAFTPVVPTLVATLNLFDGSRYLDGGSGAYGIGDPSALAWIPSLNLLYIGDSEHDESPYFSPTNLFSVTTAGAYVGNFGLGSFTKEPTGLAYNPLNGYLYVADDDKAEVFWTSPTNPTKALGSFDTERLGFLDTEDLKIDPLTGHIYILDGLMKQIVELTIDGQFVDSIKLPSAMADAEALAYDARHDVFFVGSGASPNIWLLDHQGAILQTVTTLASLSPNPKLKGFELAPSSNPDDGNALSLYVANYGNDQVNDGKLHEILLGADWFF